MKKILLCVLFVGVICAIIITIYTAFNSRRTTDNSDSGVIVTKLPDTSLTYYYVPVTAYHDYRTGIKFAELNKEKLCAFNEDKENLTAILLNQTIKYIEPAQLAAELKAGSVCLLPPSQVDFNVKTLKLDGITFWDKNVDLTAYPLQLTLTKEATPQALGLTDNLALFGKAALRERFFVSGEIIPSRAVDRLALNKNNNYTYMFDYFRQDIEQADLAWALLENPLSGDPKPCTGCMVFVGDEKNAAGFATVGYDMLSTAGNHAGDGGQGGFARNLEVLHAAGIATTGTGNTDNAKIAPAIKEVNGKRIGMIGADSVASYYWNKGGKSYGANWFSKAMNGDIDWDRVRQIKTIKEENHIDYLIIYMSWGVEYTNKATKFQTDLAHGLIDNGADLIVSSHPHWVQNVEVYKGVPIFYALGNFLFDQNHTDPTREGVNLNLYYLNHQLKYVEVMPHLACGPYITSNDMTNKYLSGAIDRAYLDTHPEKQGCVYFQPRRLATSDPKYKDILDRMLKYSSIY